MDMRAWWQRQPRSGAGVLPMEESSTLIPVKNGSGQDLVTGQILGIDGPFFTPTENNDEFRFHPAVDGVAADPTTHWGRYVILKGPIANGKIGPCMISGVAAALIYVYETCHEWADVHPNPSGNEAYYLASGQCGAARILWKESGTGLVWGIVLLYGPEMVQRFELAADLEQGSYATAYPLKPDDTPDTDPDRTFTVYDKLNKHWGWGRSDGYYRGAWGYAKRCLDSELWEVLNLEQLAHQICVTLTEDMDETSPGEATCTLDDYYRGTTPALIYYSGSDRGVLKVYDPQELFPRALSGAKAKATWDNRSHQYHLVESQQMATIIKCTTDGYTPADSNIAILSTIEVMQPITGQSPVDGNAGHDPTVMGINNTFEMPIPGGMTMIAGWNEQTDEWEVLEMLNLSTWCKTQADWAENGGDPQVSVKCYNRGTETVYGDSFYVKLPRTIDADPIVFQDHLLVAELTDSGEWHCSSTYMDGSKIGHIRFCKATEKIPEGWREMDGTNETWNMQGRTLIGRNQVDQSGWNEDTPGDAGGYKWHGVGEGSENNHDDHPDHRHVIPGSTSTYAFDSTSFYVHSDEFTDGAIEMDSMTEAAFEHNGPFNDEQDTDNRMPFRVCIMIERYK